MLGDIPSGPLDLFVSKLRIRERMSAWDVRGNTSRNVSVRGTNTGKVLRLTSVGVGHALRNHVVLSLRDDQVGDQDGEVTILVNSLDIF